MADNKENASGGNGIKNESHKEKLKRLSENGAKEVKELSLKYAGKPYKAIILVDFNLYKKAYAILLEAKYEAGEKDKTRPEVSVEMDMIGAGDKLLFFGWHEGDEEIKEKLMLRATASQKLGSWFSSLIGEANSGEEVEKKS